MDQPHVTPDALPPMPEPEPDVEDTTHIGGSRTWSVLGPDGRAYTLHWNHTAKVFAGWVGDPQPPTPSFAPVNLSVYPHPGGAATANEILADMPEYVAEALRWALGQTAPWALSQGVA